MLFYDVKFVLYSIVLLTLFDFNYTAKLKETIFEKLDIKRQKRYIDGNDLPPLPISSSSNSGGVPLVRSESVDNEQQDRSNTQNSGYRYVSSTYDSQSENQTQNENSQDDDSRIITIGRDPQIEFRSHLDTSEQDRRQQIPASTSSPPVRTGSRYQYTNEQDRRRPIPSSTSSPPVRTGSRYQYTNEQDRRRPIPSSSISPPVRTGYRYQYTTERYRQPITTTSISPPVRAESGYRYTSTVYSAPDSQTAYRYRPPSQVGYQTSGSNRQYPNTNQQGTRTRYGTGSTQNQYSPYVGSGVSYNPGSTRVQYVGGGSRYPIYNRNERVYGGSSNLIPNRGVLSNDPTCPTDPTPVFINNMGCSQAINTLGSFICYNYERVSRDCCERCLSLKKTENTGCEYGDWSYQCRNIQPFDCYNSRNRDICCEQCRLHKDRQAVVIPGCEYGDLTPRCQIIREKRHLCYLPENQRLCCLTCPSLADQDKSVCQWGDQNPELCAPFDQNSQLRINCYMPTVNQICCETCERLKSRSQYQIPGCEYGDRPVSFSTPYGVLDCGNYLRQFGVDVCNNPDVATHCCYTCYRYRTRQGKK
ncbi:unnamed protein product [Mytilus edulis]|uniref:Uncharacterized protein n=1 Tax=Mytilus edulis TaxID=6550 RepID=A0A8S3VBG4_MYTED|nr:unnamed protein product [Mytilus edulis]